METTQGLLDTLDKLSGALAANVNHQDATIDQLLAIKQTAWLLRNTAGEASLRFRPALPPARSRRNPSSPTSSSRRHRRGLERAATGGVRHAIADRAGNAMATTKTAYFEPRISTCAKGC